MEWPDGMDTGLLTTHHADENSIMTINPCRAATPAYASGVGLRGPYSTYYVRTLSSSS